MNDAHTVLQQAVADIKSAQFEEAVKLLREWLATHPADVQARWLLVQALENMQEREQALRELRVLLTHTKHDLATIDRLAKYFSQRRYPLKHVLRAYKKYVTDNPASAIAYFNFAYYLRRDGQFTLAIEMYQRALQLGIDTAEEIHLNIANIHMDQLHDHDAAKKHLHKALELNPAYGSAHYNLGNLAEQEGEREEAARQFEKCLELEPGNESALARMADTHKFERMDDPLLARMADAAKSSRNPDLLFALGRALEQVQDYDEAWHLFDRANELDKLRLPVYRAQQMEEQFGSITTQCDRAWLEQFAGQSHEPVFICGMFRTGSTLLEQVLAAHPAFMAGGESEFFPRLVARELPHYPAGLREVSRDQARVWTRAHLKQSEGLFGESTRVTDKRPDNFLYLGLIKAVLPSAKFIVTERDWRDVATSIFSVRLGFGQNYATTLRHIRHYIGLQQALVDHWATLIGPDLVRVRYEDIVRNPKETVGSLLDWLGETWDERCLSFHGLKNAVKTASVWQVREPLHARSVGRWRNYEKQFRKVFGDELDS